MDTDERTPVAGLSGALREPQALELFQAISLLEHSEPGAAPLGHGSGRGEALRLGGQVTLAFSPSDIGELRALPLAEGRDGPRRRPAAPARRRAPAAARARPRPRAARLPRPVPPPLAELPVPLAGAAPPRPAVARPGRQPAGPRAGRAGRPGPGPRRPWPGRRARLAAPRRPARHGAALDGRAGGAAERPPGLAGAGPLLRRRLAGPGPRRHPAPGSW